MTSPIQNLPEELVYERDIKRNYELTQKANIDILDIEANHRKDICSTEPENLKTSLNNIEHEIYAADNYLCTWKASQTRPQAGANEECAAAMETKHVIVSGFVSQPRHLLLDYKVECNAILYRNKSTK